MFVSKSQCLSGVFSPSAYIEHPFRKRNKYMLHMNLIGGDWVSGDAIANVKPSNTNEVVGTYARVISADTNAAIATAKAAFCSWSNSPILIRQSILSKTVQEIWARKDELGVTTARRFPKLQTKLSASGKYWTFLQAGFYAFRENYCRLCVRGVRGRW